MSQIAEIADKYARLLASETEQNIRQQRTAPGFALPASSGPLSRLTWLESGRMANAMQSSATADGSIEARNAMPYSGQQDSRYGGFMRVTDEWLQTYADALADATLQDSDL